MNKQDFIQKFQLQPLEPSSQTFVFPSKLKEAAVLIALCEMNKGEVSNAEVASDKAQDELSLSVVLTKRASHLKHHAGQISFPGGKVESSDTSKAETALREAEEEIGLNRQQVTVLGQLSDYHTITGFNVTPVVGVISGDFDLSIDENEVAEVFTVPLKHFIDGDSHTKLPMYHRGHKHYVHFMPYQEHQIWGATAAIIADLVAHLMPQPA
ncbi:CoA pyrophosphatase [Thalassotalea montiporae]